MENEKTNELDYKNMIDLQKEQYSNDN